MHLLQVLNAVAMTSAAAPASDDNLSVDLDWRPTLSAAQEVICWSCAAVAACLVYLFTAPAGLNILYATCIGLLFGLVLYAMRNALLEEMYKARERIEADLGDADSRFRHIDNLSVHVKVKASRSLPPPVPTAGAASLAPPSAAAARLQGAVPALHCYHGFGSNTWSWSLVQQQLAERLGALVTAHDMPGFGLTQRPTDLSGYYLAFNGRLGRLVMDYELTVRGLLTRAEAARSGEAGYPHTSVLAATLDAPAEGSGAAAAPAAAAAAAHDPTAAAAAAAADQDAAAVEAIEQESGGSATEAAGAAVEQGLESPLQATAAAAAGEGSVAGMVKGAAAAAADAATGGSSSDNSEAAATAAKPSGASTSSKQDQQRVQRVLMGHSLGGACAALEYVFNPSEYAAIVLVAPAIMAGLRSNGSSTLEQLQDGTAFTRSLASGEFEQPETAAAAAQEAAAAGRVTRASSSSSMGWAPRAEAVNCLAASL
ncbi:hypothetical protein COO60DRAFT_436035 [Scenedesmus sp. NREL 46B-D3]|nr:hypothetical protein COO60DRAFT_436035 [Scenedesmus sp. NREL 46B-D3]